MSIINEILDLFYSNNSKNTVNLKFKGWSDDSFMPLLFKTFVLNLQPLVLEILEEVHYRRKIFRPLIYRVRFIVMVYMVLCRNENFWYGSLQENYGSLQEIQKIVVHCRNYGWVQEFWFSTGSIMIQCRNLLKILVVCRNNGLKQELWFCAGIKWYVNKEHQKTTIGLPWGLALGLKYMS